MTLTATATVPPAGAVPPVLSAQSTLSGGTGDFRATSLSPASSYDSQTTDGETAQSNSQPGQMGEAPCQPVDTWDLKYRWLPGDSGNNDMALYSITHSRDMGGNKPGALQIHPAWVR